MRRQRLAVAKGAARETDLGRALGRECVAPVKLARLEAILATLLLAATSIPAAVLLPLRDRLPPSLTFRVAQPAASFVDDDAARRFALPALALVRAHIGLVHGHELVQAFWLPDDHLGVRDLVSPERVPDGHAVPDGHVRPDLVLRLRVLRTAGRPHTQPGRGGSGGSECELQQKARANAKVDSKKRTVDVSHRSRVDSSGFVSSVLRSKLSRNL
mmetsp:Transcript_21057/g.47215  ORF Transcript_21057/g.47215 Transcript_21057/m.47215 type:complete len:215 (-) Transcript_21057:1364-2008(-)